MRREKLIIFVKAPRPGHVKTRMAKTIGDAASVSAYRTLVKVLINRLRKLSEIELRFSPDDAYSEIQPWLSADWSAHPQGDGDLGQRLELAITTAFDSGHEKVVIIGSDCPFVSEGDIRSAWAALSDHDLVLGPATDGGYWLIGLRQPASSLFKQIDWSTSSVFQTTLQRARNAGLSIKVLRELSDVDTESDWKQFLTATKMSEDTRMVGCAPPCAGKDIVVARAMLPGSCAETN